MRDERELLTDCLRRLNTLGLPYLLTGSMASNYWGVPRTTHDLDFVVRLTAADVPAVVGAFANDFFIQESAVRAAFSPPHQFNALDNASALKVDFWVLGDAPFEQAMFGRRHLVSLFGEPAWIASAEDVLLHKLYWDALTPSERQRTDAAGIAAVQRDRLDLAYLRQWARSLGVEARLDDVLRGNIPLKET
jgi:hypothetical protein